MYRKGLQTGQVLASLLSEGGMATFNRRYEVLQSIINFWQLGEEVAVCPIAAEAGNSETATVKEENEILPQMIKRRRPKGGLPKSKKRKSGAGYKYQL
jgi:hypothetical protein